MVLLAFAAGGSSSDRKRATSVQISAESSRELRIPNAAAQTRMVSVAKIRLDRRKSTRLFKGIICDDISEIAVGTLITERPPQSGRVEARIGLRMMPTFPRPSLSFRTAGFPRYGWKAGM